MVTVVSWVSSLRSVSRQQSRNPGFPLDSSERDPRVYRELREEERKVRYLLEEYEYVLECTEGRKSRTVRYVYLTLKNQCIKFDTFPYLYKEPRQKDDTSTNDSVDYVCP